MKLAIFDMDGTLFDTIEVNYRAYKSALNDCGFDLSRDFFEKECNGKNYKEFLVPIVGTDMEIQKKVHIKKKEAYSKYLNCAKCNYNLLTVIRAMKSSELFYTALVTTASKKNCMEILTMFEATELFDLILTQEDVEELKPSPLGFQKAMAHFGIAPEDTLIFEDSEVGLQAAARSEASYMKVYGYN